MRCARALARAARTTIGPAHRRRPKASAASKSAAAEQSAQRARNALCAQGAPLAHHAKLRPVLDDVVERRDELITHPAIVMQRHDGLRMAEPRRDQRALHAPPPVDEDEVEWPPEA